MKTYSSEVKPQSGKKIQIDCPVCGKAASRPYLVLPECSFVKCSSCGLVYQNPQPLFVDLRDRYSRTYFEYEIANEENFYKLMRLGLKDIGFDEAFFARAPDKTFLDIGCATGRLLGAMKELGYTVEGVELCEQSAQYGMEKRRVPIYTGTLEDAHLPDDSFSFIHFSHLIEHVPDPRGFLLEVKRILKKGGYAIITTPNIEGFQAQFFKEAWRSAIPDHLFLFSKATLYKLLNDLGFSIKRTVTWGGLAKGTVPGWIKKSVDFLAKRLGFGDVMLVLARNAGV
jgi:2-polyprenyl-3-methyl-5-hydroxy-6-metoxy-1,4-benzoquinol methylase